MREALSPVGWYRSMAPRCRPTLLIKGQSERNMFLYIYSLRSFIVEIEIVRMEKDILHIVEVPNSHQLSCLDNSLVRENSYFLAALDQRMEIESLYNIKIFCLFIRYTTWFHK